MYNIIVFSNNGKSLLELKTLAESKNFKVYSTYDKAKAVEWFRSLPVSCLFVDSSTDITTQQALGGELWKNSPQAQFLVFDFDIESGRKLEEIKLFGADIAKGKNAREIIIKALELIGPKTAILIPENFKILVVEDLDSPREIIMAYIQGIGYPNVTGKGSVKEAIEELESNPGKYSCVLTDIRMPQHTGKDLIDTIRADKNLKHLPIIVLTAYGTLDWLVDCVRAGATGFLVKPPRKADLSRELARAQRIFATGGNPRLARPEEAEAMRDILVQRGFS